MSDIADQAELLTPPGGLTLRLRFRGPFEGREITWDGQLFTLAAWRQHHPHSDVRQNFIEVGEESPQGIALTVVLDVPQIDLPTVRKTMMMVRQYKRLRRGRHLYGRAAG
jgi:hypothetical protein